MTPARAARRRLFLPLATLAVIAGLLGLTLPRMAADAAPLPAVVSAGHGHGGAAATPAPRTAGQITLHDGMRRLWEDHVTWTRMAIVTFAAQGQPGFGPTAARLLQNQVDIGNAIKPYYGDAAGNRLTALLTDHITIAVEVMTAAKAGDGAAFDAATARWYANGNDIADFLAGANPSWPQATMRADMKMHLDQTLAEAADELGGKYADSVAEYDEVHAHILAMADLLSSGIIAQFPHKVR